MASNLVSAKIQENKFKYFFPASKTTAWAKKADDFLCLKKGHVSFEYSPVLPCQCGGKLSV